LLSIIKETFSIEAGKTNVSRWCGSDQGHRNARSSSSLATSGIPEGNSSLKGESENKCGGDLKQQEKEASTRENNLLLTVERRFAIRGERPRAQLVSALMKLRGPALLQRRDLIQRERGERTDAVEQERKCLQKTPRGKSASTKRRKAGRSGASEGRGSRANRLQGREEKNFPEEKGKKKRRQSTRRGKKKLPTLPTTNTKREIRTTIANAAKREAGTSLSDEKEGGGQNPL